MRWLAKLGWSEMDAGGAGLIMADAAVQYLAQGHHGDELSVEMGAAGVAGVGFSLLYRIRRISDGLVLAKCRQAWCVSIMASSVSAVCLGIENGIGGRLKWRNQTILRFILNAI